MQVDYYSYKEEDFTCPNCSWQGKGDQLVFGDFSEVHSICDLKCPECYEIIAFWQAPLFKKDDDK